MKPLAFSCTKWWTSIAKWSNFDLLKFLLQRQKYRFILFQYAHALCKVGWSKLLKPTKHQQDLSAERLKYKFKSLQETCNFLLTNYFKSLVSIIIVNNLFVVAGGKVEKLNDFKTNHHDVASHVRTYPVKIAKILIFWQILLGFSRSLCSAIRHKGKTSVWPLAQAGCKMRESLVACSQKVARPLTPKSKRHFQSICHNLFFWICQRSACSWPTTMSKRGFAGSIVIAQDFPLKFAGFFPLEKSRKTREISCTSLEKSGK